VLAGTASGASQSVAHLSAYDNINMFNYGSNSAASSIRAYTAWGLSGKYVTTKVRWKDPLDAFDPFWMLYSIRTLGGCLYRHTGLGTTERTYSYSVYNPGWSREKRNSNYDKMSDYVGY